jgi:predicted DNA-binding protein (UPF0251 family)
LRYNTCKIEHAFYFVSTAFAIHEGHSSTMANIFDLITEAIREQLRAGRTQQDLARELGVSQTTVSGILRGTRRVGRKTAEAVLRANPPWLQLFLWRGGR